MDIKYTCPKTLKGKHMKKNIILISLALLTLSGAILEVLIENIPSQFIQINGLLTIVCAGICVTWNLKLRAEVLH